ncbi:Uncharacterised protein [Kluyvera intermedia]|nr:Uncharacterised protein [Kluyvera intermedia]
MLDFIKPGKPTQNAFIERFNRTYRTEILDFYLFRTLNEAREITERWLNEYNRERPHESLNNLTPEEYRLMAEKPENLKKRVELKLGYLQDEFDFDNSLWRIPAKREEIKGVRYSYRGMKMKRNISFLLAGRRWFC